MKVSDIINFIEKTAPLNLASAWDKSGVQVMAFHEDIQHVAVMLDPTLENILKAQNSGADFILAHHPLAMEPQYPDSLGNYHSILAALFKADTLLYSSHTSLDANPFGPVRWLADALSLKNVEVLELEGQTLISKNGKEINTDYGFGFIGSLPSPIAYENFVKALSKHTHKKVWRTCGPRPEFIQRVACCPGSGGSVLSAAENKQADVFITGDMRYHAALDALIHVIDIGHFQLEEIMMEKFAELLEKEFSEVKVSFIPSFDPFTFELI